MDTIFKHYENGEVIISLPSNIINKGIEYIDNLRKEHQEKNDGTEFVISDIYIYPVSSYTTKSVETINIVEKTDEGLKNIGKTEKIQYHVNTVSYGCLKDEDMEKNIPKLKLFRLWKTLFVKLKDLLNEEPSENESEKYDYPIYIFNSTYNNYNVFCNLVQESVMMSQLSKLKI